MSTHEQAEQCAVYALRIMDLEASVRQLAQCLQNWVEIQDPEDARDYDSAALAEARRLVGPLE